MRKYICNWMFMVACLFCIILQVQPSLFPFGAGTDDVGLDPDDDDGYPFTLSKPFLFFDTSYDTILYTDNGIISFEEFRDYTPNRSLRDNYPAIKAVLHDDMIGNGNLIYARESTTASDLMLATTYVEELFTDLSPYTADRVIVVTWDRFPLYGRRTQGNNTYQGVIVISSTVNVVLMLYEDLQNVDSNAVVGVNAGDGVQFEELLPQSRTSAVLDLDSTAQAVTIGLFGFRVHVHVRTDPPVTILYPEPQPAVVYYITNSSDSNLVNVFVTVRSNTSYYLQALNTTDFDRGLRSELPESSCRSNESGLFANLSLTVNVSNSDHPGCGVIYENGLINMTIEAVQQFGFYQGNDSVFRLSCNVLPYERSVNLRAGDILSTTIPSMTGRSVSLRFQDGQNVEGSQTLTSTDCVVVGRYVFPTICFERGTPYTPNVDPYGVYVYSCQLANNPLFSNNRDNETLDIVGNDGCLLRSSDQTGGLVHSFRKNSKSNSLDSPFCIITGGFKAFGLLSGENKIYMRCLVGYCTNTQVYEQSKCKDSCRYSSVDTNMADTDDSRRKRNDRTYTKGDEVFAVMNVKNAEYKSGSSAYQDCINKYTARLVILSLFTFLILATMLTLLLFCIYIGRF